jgi:ABC-2 type transport system ATP-binding protein
VRQGEFVAVVGHNGAGKSTFLKMLAGWLRPDAGDALIDGVSIKDRLAVVRKIGFVPETPNLYEQFSVEYNLALFARLFALPAARVEAMLQEFDLGTHRRAKVQALSKGLKQRVSLGRCLLADPPVLLFDEPTSGLDFEITKEVYRRLKAVHAAGKTILFTSHRPEELKMLATRIVVLHGGQAVFDGTPDDYFRSKAHQELYS